MACFTLASLALFSVPNAHRRKLYDNAEVSRKTGKLPHTVEEAATGIFFKHAKKCEFMRT